MSASVAPVTVTWQQRCTGRCGAACDFPLPWRAVQCKQLKSSMVCESERQSWTVLNWAVQDQSPDSWSCRGFSPRWKRLTKLWCCFDWRSMVLFFASSVFKVLHIWPFTAWTPHAAMQRKWLFKWSRLLCLLACPARCFFIELHRKPSWADYLSSADVDLNV